MAVLAPPLWGAGVSKISIPNAQLLTLDEISFGEKGRSLTDRRRCGLPYPLLAQPLQCTVTSIVSIINDCFILSKTMLFNRSASHALFITLLSMYRLKIH